MKIQDRLLLGIVAGLGGNLAKLAIGKTGKKMQWAELHGPDMAAGMFIPPVKLASTQGRVAGLIADSVIAGVLGVVIVYGLSLSGRNQAPIKGLATGSAMWTGVYGIASAMGLTKVKPHSPTTVLNEFVSHSIYGLVTATLAVKLGDEGLFNGQTSLFACPVAQMNSPDSHSPLGNKSVPDSLSIPKP